MRKIRLAAAAAVPVLAAATALAAAGPASASQLICLQGHGSLCLDKPAAGNQVQVDGGYSWGETGEGTVSGGRYNGAHIIQLQSGSTCVRTNSSNPLVLTTGGCGQAAWLIEWGNYLVDYSQTMSTGIELVVETEGFSKGDDVIVDNPESGGYADWNY